MRTDDPTHLRNRRALEVSRDDDDSERGTVKQNI